VTPTAPGQGPVDVSIVTSGHDVADARLHRVSAALVERGLTVEVLGLGDPAGAPPGTRMRTRPRGSMASRALAAVAYAAQARGRVVMVLDPDSLLAARALAVVRRRPVVADVHEDYAALLRDRAWARGLLGRLGALVAALATWTAQRCALVVVADDHLPPREAANRLVVRNLPDLRMLPEPGDREPAPRALYVGDVRGSRGLFAMLDALEQAPGWSVDIVGPVREGDRVAAEDRLTGDLAGRVRFHGRQPPRAAWRLAAGAWCGLLLLDDTPAFREALPSKLYEYLGCGLPVVVTDLPRQAAMVGDARAGVVVPSGPLSGAATAAVLRGWSSERAGLEAVTEGARCWAAAHRDENPYAELAARVASLAGR
jgi:glycosyltransferase involved in cell wall biosynthesis